VTFYDFLIRHFKKVKSHVFGNLKKKRKIHILEHWQQQLDNFSDCNCALSVKDGHKMYNNIRKNVSILNVINSEICSTAVIVA